jgi:hypothetical protein
MGIEPLAFMSKMVNRVEFSEEDKALLKSEADWGVIVAPDMAKVFYAYLERDEEMNKILNRDKESIVRLHKTFIEWFQEMFTGMDSWGQNYAERRWKIGLIHFRLGIEPQHVVPAMATVVNEVGKRLQTDGKNQALRESLERICMIDLAFIEQAYLELPMAAIIRETGWTEDLFRRLVATGVRSI